MSNEIPVKEIGELLDEVTNKVPKLIGSFMDIMFSAEAGKKMGQAVGCLYKELIDAGIPQEYALKMAKDYMLSLKDVTSNFTKDN